MRRDEQEGDNQEDSPAAGTSSTPKQAAQVDQTYPEATAEVETINARKTSRAVGRHLRKNAIRRTSTAASYEEKQPQDLRMMEGHPDR